MKKPKKLRQQFFNSLRKEGIYKANITILKDRNAVFQRERQPVKDNSQDVVMCGSCKGFFSRTFYCRHKRHCQKESCPPVPVSISMLKNPYMEKVSEDFKIKILATLRDDEAGKISKTDPTILTVGGYLFDKVKRKFDKKMEVIRSVRNDMRRLSHLYIEFLKQKGVQVFFKDSADMLRRENFIQLKSAIDVYTTKEDSSLKSGLKQALYYLIKAAVKAMKGTFLIANKDRHARALDDFVSVLELSKDLVFGDATYHLNKDRQIRLRKPAQLPLETDVESLRLYILGRIKAITGD